MASPMNKKILYPLIISLFIIFIGIVLYGKGKDIPFLYDMHLKSIDVMFRLRGKIDPKPDVVLAVVDEESIEKEGKWVWPRSKFANLITKLSNAGASVIAFDIGFLEPDSHGIIQTIDQVQRKANQLNLDDTDFNLFLSDLKKRSDNDRILADAITNSEAKVVLGYFFHMESDGLDIIDEKRINAHKNNIRSSTYGMVRYDSRDDSSAFFKTAYLPQSNIPIISASAAYSGYFNMIPDYDGVLRWIPGVIKFEDNLYAPLFLKAVSAYLNKPVSIKIQKDYGVTELRIGKHKIPVREEDGAFMVNYRGPGKTFKHIPITRILSGNFQEDEVKNKIVMVGATATAIYDLRATPFDEVYPGLEIHANAVDNILSSNFLHRPDWAGLFDVFAIIFIGLFLGIVLPRIGPVAGGISGLLLFSGHIILCQYLFSEMGWILNMVYPLFVLLLVYTSITAYRYLIEEAQKKFIRSAFSTYLAPSVVKQLEDSPDKLVLGGEEREITAFFSDVQGFTSISEKLDPSELVELLNEFLTEMTDIILEHQGTVDKFEGDAIIAFFGAPNAMENHAEAGAEVCLKMQNRMEELREIWKASGKPQLKMRIGLYTGLAVVGNMGSKSRMDYTMMGNTVNTAARLEGVNKIYGIYTLIGETTYEAVKDKIMAREIDSIQVIGKRRPVIIYQPIGFHDDINETILETVDHYHKGLFAYRNKDWNKAAGFFESALEISPDDNPSKEMFKRCNVFKADPPGKDWNGTYTMTTK